MIKISTYRAIDEPEKCDEYINGHVKVLKDYGIESITSNNNEWINNQNMYCVTAFDDTNEMVGGIRIQLRDRVHPLPVEVAVGNVDAKIYDIIEHYHNNGGIGELCGLWNSKKIRKIGVSTVLIHSAISIINQLNFQTLTGICAEYSLEMFQNVGFVINKDLGNEGQFIYPNENYIARVVGILNSVTLETAAPYNREIMISLRTNPTQKRTEIGPKGKFEVDYDLLVKIK